MERYRGNRLIPALGGAFAVLATTATLALSVVAPAKLMPNTDPNALARVAPAASPQPTEIAAARWRIDVVGVREKAA